MKIFLKRHLLGVTILIFVALLASILLFTNNIFTIFINMINHQRKVTISIEDLQSSFFVPSFLQTQDELKTKKNVYANISGGIELYSKDKKVNQYYYQISGMDVTLGLGIPWHASTENIPFDLAKKTVIQSSVGTVTLYTYPGADGDGHGRGHLGYVFQGDILFKLHTNQNYSVGLFFSCYDHSSGGSISVRCAKTIQMLLKTVHAENNILFKFFDRFILFS